MKKQVLIVFFLVSFLSLRILNAQTNSTNAEALRSLLKSATRWEIAETEGRYRLIFDIPAIGSSNTHHAPASKSITINLPKFARVLDFSAYISDPSDGNKVKGPVPVVGYKGQGYTEPYGWAYINLDRFDSGQFKITFYSWKHDTGRPARLEVIILVDRILYEIEGL